MLLTRASPSERAKRQTSAQSSAYRARRSRPFSHCFFDGRKARGNQISCPARSAASPSEDEEYGSKKTVAHPKRAHVVSRTRSSSDPRLDRSTRARVFRPAFHSEVPGMRWKDTGARDTLRSIVRLCTVLHFLTLIIDAARTSTQKNATM